MSFLNGSIHEAKKFVPVEFNRKLRPLSELKFWKASELRLFMLYEGIVVLKSRSVLSKAKYRHFLKYCCAMRLLLSPDSCNNDIPLCANLLTEFCHGCVSLYGKGFITYNIHSLIHLIEDFEQYGSLDSISCFVFESYLGLLKNIVKSGYRPLEQIANRVWYSNDTVVDDYKKKNSFKAEFLSPLKSTVESSSEDIDACCHYRNARLSSGCIINVASIADSTVQYHEKIAKVVGIFKSAEGRNYFEVQKYKTVCNFFSRPIHSSKVGIFLVDELNKNCSLIEFNDVIKKCALFPYKSKFVSITLNHAL